MATTNIASESSSGRKMTLAGFGVPLLLFAAVFSSYLHGHMGCVDSMWSIPTAVSLLDRGDVDLDEFTSLLEARRFSFTEQVGGRRYTVYPFATSVLAAPFILGLRPLADAVFRMWPSLRADMQRAQAERGCAPLPAEPVVSLHSWTEQIVASAIVALTAVILYTIAHGELSAGGAALIALIFAFGTSAWSTASRSLWQHGPSMLMLSLALMLQRPPSPQSLSSGFGEPRPPSPQGLPSAARGTARLFFVGAALAFAYAIRPTNAVPLALGAAWVALCYPRRLLSCLAGVGVVLVPFLAANQIIYGAWLPPYFSPQFFGGRNPFFGEALAGSLVSPGRGLLIYSPVLLFVAAGVAIKIQARRFTALDLSVLMCIFLHWIGTAWVNRVWWGGYSYGPRFFTDMLPYLVYFLIPVVGWLGSTSGVRRAVVGTAFVVAATISVLMHAQGVFNRGTVLWNQRPMSIDIDPARLWDWHRPPFLAGVQAPQEAEALAPDAIRCETAPSSPERLTTVENNRGMVTLSWSPAAGVVASYILDVGTGPGLADLASQEIRTVRQTSLTVSRAPPGRYYVRVRAKNPCGISSPSNEILVVVQY